MDRVLRVYDPDGREVVFDYGTWLHLAIGDRPWLLDHIEILLAAVELPEHRADDRIAGREHFCARPLLLRGRWLRVIVDFNYDPAWIVTAVIQDHDPRRAT